MARLQRLIGGGTVAALGGTALVGAGTALAFAGDAWTGPVAVALVVSGFVVAVLGLAARDQHAAQRRNDPSRASKWLATTLIVVLGLGGGVLAAQTDTDAWFAAALFCALVILCARPGVID